jgi:archaellum biogenesis ATPase FlaH
LKGDSVALNIDKLIVSKIIQDQDITHVADIPSDFIFDEKYRDAYEYILDYHLEHGEVPTERVMKADCPNILLTPVDEPWSDLIERLEEKYVGGVLDENLALVNEYLQVGDTKQAINALGLAASLVHTVIPNKRDVDATQTGEERLARYEERRANPGRMVGIPCGYPTIDRATQGFQKGQFIALTGLTKASKSALSMTFAMAAQQAGMRVLYLTYEMTCDEQTNRLDAYRAGFNDNKLNNGDLSHEDMEKLRKGIHTTENLPTMVFAEDVMTVTAISAKCDVVKPDIVIVDGAYMLEDEKGEPTGSPQALAHIARGLKILAMRRKICIIGVTQSTPARTKGETLNTDSIMGSRAWSHYANVGIGIERTDDVKIRKLRILFSRSCTPTDVMLEFDFDTGTFQEIPDMEDVDQELGELLDHETFDDSF